MLRLADLNINGATPKTGTKSVTCLLSLAIQLQMWRVGTGMGWGPQGGDFTPSYSRTRGLKLEGNGSLFSLEGGKWCPPIWV